MMIVASVPSLKLAVFQEEMMVGGGSNSRGRVQLRQKTTNQFPSSGIFYVARLLFFLVTYTNFTQKDLSAFFPTGPIFFATPREGNK
jgi:hypothetical protein